MRTKRATRYNHEHEHASYGLYNWFKSKGISNKEIILETCGNFCEANGFQVTVKTKEQQVVNYCSNRFQKFAVFAVGFLKDNNYIKQDTTPDWVKEIK